MTLTQRRRASQLPRRLAEHAVLRVRAKLVGGEALIECADAALRGQPAHLRGVIVRLAAFFEIDARPGFLDALAEASTLRAMQKDGDVLLEGADIASRGGYRRSLNKGMHGRWCGIYRPAECAHWLASRGRI